MKLAECKKLYLIAMITYFVAYIAILVADIEPLSSYGDIIELVGISIALSAFVTGIFAHSKGDRLPWVCFFLTATCSFIGEGLWSYYTHILHSAPGSTSVCDIFYVLYSLFCICGIVAFLRRNRGINLVGFSADLIITLVASAGLIYIFLIFPVLEDAQKSLWDLILQISYPVFDFGILFGCLVLFFNVGSGVFFKRSLFLMILGFIIVFVADQINLFSELHEIDIVLYIEPLWPLSYCFLSISCIVSAEEAKRNCRESFMSSSQEHVIEIIRLLVPYCITFSAISFVFVEYKLYNFVFCWAMFLVVILSIRQFFVLVSNRHLYRELLKLNLQVTREAQMDFLTKLANRRHIDVILDQYKEEPYDKAFGLLFIDVDLFKNVNDTYGHDVGDQALRAVAKAIRDSVRDSDIAGRFGGDEFIVLLPSATKCALRAIGERIQQHLSENTELAYLKLTLSIGGAYMDPDGDFNTLLKSADQAVYTAKQAGRNRIVIAN